MNNIGVIFCAFNCAETINKCLKPWKDIKNDNFIYSCVSVPFKQYKEHNIIEDNTIELIRAANIIDFHVTEPKFIEEVEARGLCLEYLKSQNCDIVFQVDSDEFYSVDDIKNILKYIEKYPSFAWYKLCLKNYIFDEKHYLEKPFCPPRIFRVKYLPFLLNRFYQDNDISYLYNGNEIANSALKNKLIPQKIAFIKHITWMSNESSKNKVKYQIERWQTCSYRWNELENKLEFNPDYIEYKKNGFPKVIEEV